MKSSRKWILMLLAGGALALHAGIAGYLRNLEATSLLQDVFFRLVPVGTTSVRMRRPPAETLPALAEKIRLAPTDAELHAYRSWESERALRFDDAEKEAQEYTRLARDKESAYLFLADYYHRRINPASELAALSHAANETNPISDRLIPPAGRRSWKIFERMLAVVTDQALFPEQGIEVFQAWERKFQNEPEVLRRYFTYLVQNNRVTEAQVIIARYRRIFPADLVFPVQARASLASGHEAIAVYDQSFQPLWPPELVRSYFQLLEKTHSLRRFLADARAAAVSHPEDVVPVARLFDYWQQQGNPAAARRALLEYAQRKSRWTPDELRITARLLEGVNSYDDAAHAWYTLYQLPSAGDTGKRDALAELARLLLAAPDQPIRIGAGDLSMYRDIGTADPHPGFLNGVLSLLLNSTYPSSEFETQQRSSVAYFHRAKAAALIGLLDQRYPDAPQRASLHADLLQAYSAYGLDDPVIKGSSDFLKRYPKSPERTRVALLEAEAHARKGQVAEEMAVYSGLLEELGAAADHVPLGQALAEALRSQAEAQAGESDASPSFDSPATGQPAARRTARSPEYERVLDRYLARLVTLKRLPDALKVYRQELSRNPDDPGLYERFAAFIEQNKLGAEVETVYQSAIAQFKSRAWYERLARWYLRQKRHDDFARLAGQVAAIFSGSDLEQYLSDLVTPRFDAVLYRQVNLFANRRFPNNLAFVQNLLTAYSSAATRDNLACQRLLRNYWYYDDNLRQRYFEELSRNNQLPGAIAAVRQNPTSPATTRWLGEAEAWRSHFEDAAGYLATAAGEDPGNVDVMARAAAVERSLGHTGSAAALATKLASFEPADSEVLARIGDIYADKEQYGQARPFWNRIPSIAPGRRQLYLEAATVFWDYFLYDDALRLIGEARAKFHDPTLYAYESGAIYENKREPERAVTEYVAGALAADGASAARSRLMVLSTRPNWQPLIEKKTSSLGTDSPAAISLRTVVLARQERWKDLEAMLSTLALRATSLDLLERIGQEADLNRFQTVKEQALRRQAEVTPDPVEKVRYQLALARQLEDRKDIKAARRVIETLYKTNPAILGVVRATVDFYMRAKDPHRAVDTLLHSASLAQPVYRSAFTLEASRKLTASGDFKRARKLLQPLLAQSPFDANDLASMADTFAAAKDDAGLRDFYAAKLAEPGAPKSVLRRGMIPALTRLTEYPAAVDQYIELIKAFPDDETLANEAAAYASSHSLKDRLLGYFTTAEKDSPKDSRWPVVTARVCTWFEDYPAAIAAWTRAAALRPDRPEILASRAALEERLLRLDAAAKTYGRLYELAYHNPEWMAKLAEMQARMGNAAAAEESLRKAYLDGRPATAANYLAVAAKLADWNLLDRAKPYAGQGVAADGKSSPVADRIYARLRDYDAALQSNGIEIGEVAAQYYTPEEKSRLAERLVKMPPASSRGAIAAQASMTGLEVEWLYQQMLAQPGEQTYWLSQQLAQVQGRRLQFNQLGRQLEAYWKVFPDNPRKDQILEAAAAAYRSAGNRSEELRILTLRLNHPPVSDRVADRYLALLAGNSEQLLAAAGPGKSDNVRDRAVTAAIAGGGAPLALNAVAARGTGLPPVWTGAYTGLVGLYFRAPQVNHAFVDILGPRTVGEQIGRKPDLTRELTGNTWFYYAGRYGDFLAATGQPGGEDFLPAMVENRSGNPAAYFDLAETLRERGQYGRAVEEFQRSIELNGAWAIAYDRIALVFAARNQPDQAAAAWRKAFETFTRALRERRPEQEFWPNVRETLNHAGSSGMLQSLKPEVDRLLRLYIQRNGTYMVNPLLEGLVESSKDATAALAWIASLSRSAANPYGFLETVLSSEWLPETGRDILYQRQIEAASTAAANARGAEREYAEQTPRNARLQYLEYLLEEKRPAAALELLDSFSASDRLALGDALVVDEVRLAAMNGAIGALIGRYQRNPQQMPSVESLQRAAAATRKDGNGSAAQQLLEFLYANSLQSRQLTASNFLGLAEIRLEQNRLPEATQLLKRMTLVTGEPFENLMPAADLLLRFHHPEEAATFLSQRVQAAPWDFTARRKLAEVRNDRMALKAIAADGQAPYADRVAAAPKAAPGSYGSSELDLIARPGPISAAEAGQPYFFAARLEAAARAREPKTKIPLLAGALAARPNDDAPRLPLFRAAVSAGDCPMAIASMSAKLDSGLQFQLENNSDVTNAGSLRYYAQSFLPEAGLDTPQRLEVARAMSACYENMEQTRAAALLLRIAQRLEPPAAEAASIRTRLGALAAASERAEANVSRRPVISKALEQGRIVRPRLVKGGAQ